MRETSALELSSSSDFGVEKLAGDAVAVAPKPLKPPQFTFEVGQHRGTPETLCIIASHLQYQQMDQS